MSMFRTIKVVSLCIVATAATCNNLAYSQATGVEYPVENWPTNGGNLYNQRYSPLDEINRENITRLKGVWQTRLDGSGDGPKYSGEAQPIIIDGVIYVVTGADDVFALSVESGQKIWTYKADLDPEINTVCCGWTSRGVGFGDNKVFVGQLDGKLVALDKDTGKVLWQVQSERWQDGYTITSAPLYYDGLVITGFAGAEYATRGRVKAYDAETGKLVWTFYVVPGPGEPGHETWPQDNNTWKYGGGAVWQTPAIDPELGLIYFATGNPGPDLNGAVRAGDNLYTSSIVALDVKTGKYEWHFQTVHHDLWDYDMPNPVILYDANYNGVERKALAAAHKTGWLYILDRETGDPLIGIEEKPVPQEPKQATSPTQPYPVGESFSPQFVENSMDGIPLVNEGRIFTPFLTDPVVIKPGSGGGASWPPSSYDPATDTFFVCARDQADIYQGGDRDFDEPTAGEDYLGGVFASTSKPATGIVAAMDLITNTVKWSVKWPDKCFSGSIMTKGGLLFVGKNDGRLTALNSSTGEQLWEFQMGAGANSTASIFEHKGKQYIAFYAAGNLIAGSPRGDRVWLLSLDGTLDQLPPPLKPAPVDIEATSGSMDLGRMANTVRGKLIYNEACQGCHGSNGEGGHGGKSFENTGSVFEAIKVIRNGTGNMPGFYDFYSDEEIHDVAEYIQELNEDLNP